MAILIPPYEEIDLLPTPLTPGERSLMDALLGALDDRWTIFIQPHLNGIRPDIIAYSEEFGLGIFEVKDWDLEYYKILSQGKSYEWLRFDSTLNEWKTSDYECPCKQVGRYRNSIFKYEIPILGAYSSIDKRVNQYVSSFVYFHKHTTKDIDKILDELLEKYKYTNVFGNDKLDHESFKEYLSHTHLTRYFDRDLLFYLQEQNIDLRIRNALLYKSGPLDINSLLVKFSSHQEELLSDYPKKRRILGVAGSGKSLVLVRKAVKAARSGKKVLMVCYNITMANYLRDMANCLANHYGPDVHRNIVIRHFHRMFPGDEDKDIGDIPKVIDVLLVDEGQDFEREWIERLDASFSPVHFMFFEDERQNIYGTDTRKRRQTPGFLGRPYKLSESFRLTREIAQIANALIKWKQLDEDETGEVETIKQLPLLLSYPLPKWANCQSENILQSFTSNLQNRYFHSDEKTYENTVILVCTIETGWEILDLLEKIKIPYQSNFETRLQNKAVISQYKGRDLENALRSLRRGLKASFSMRNGKIKVCTIHSFKGWELDDVIILFNPVDKQEEIKTSLLYTAITRSMSNLTIYNADPAFNEFGTMAINKKLLEEMVVPILHGDKQPLPSKMDKIIVDQITSGSK